MKIKEVRIYEYPPGRFKRYLIDVRVIDPSQGSYISVNGFELMNYDKAFAVECNYLGAGLRRVGNKLTEMFCND